MIELFYYSTAFLILNSESVRFFFLKLNPKN